MFNQFAILSGASTGDPRNLDVGEVGLLNAATSYAAPFSQHLTQYAVGAERASGIADLREFLAPTVNVASRRFDFLEYDAKTQLPNIGMKDVVRGRGADFKTAIVNAGEKTGKVENIGLSTVVEFADEVEDPNLKNDAIDFLSEQVDAAELLWAFDMLDGIAVAETVSAATVSDIDGFIKQKIQTNFDTTGVACNRIFFGAGAWARRDYTYRNATLTPGNLAYAKNANELSDYLALTVRSGDPRSISAEGVLPTVRSNNIYCFFAKDGATRRDTSNLKTFSAPGLNGHSSEIYESENFQGTRRHYTLSRWKKVLVANGLGVMKLTFTD